MVSNQQVRPLKIIHCVNQYMPLHMAGTEVYIHTLACLQSQDGHKVSIVTPHIEHYRPEQINRYYIYDGINVYQYMEGGDPKNRDYISGKKKPEGLPDFYKCVELLQPDIVHFHELNRSIGLGIEHVKLAKKYGAKIVLTMHLSSYTCNTNTLIKDKQLCNGRISEFECSVCTYKTKFNIPGVFSVPTAIASVILKKSGIISLLPAGKATTVLAMPGAIGRIKKELEELSDNIDMFVSLTEWYKKILLINGVPSKKIAVIEQALAASKQSIFKRNDLSASLPLKMVFIGRIQPQKGVHLMIETLCLFDDAIVTVDIYGMPEDTVYYKQCINASAGKSSIKWKGQIARESVVECLTGYDMLLLPSTFSEMSPLVIQEAFAAGIPVLASKVYGNAEQIKPGKNGLLFEFNSSQSLQEKIQMLANEPALVQHLKDNIQSPVYFEEVNKAYMQVYHESEYC